jgi:hypothetical protein
MSTSNTGPTAINQNYIHEEAKSDEIWGMLATVLFRNYLPYE